MTPGTMIIYNTRLRHRGSNNNTSPRCLLATAPRQQPSSSSNSSSAPPLVSGSIGSTGARASSPPSTGNIAQSVRHYNVM